jgi:hypothetical protein
MSGIAEAFGIPKKNLTAVGAIDKLSGFGIQVSGSCSLRAYLNSDSISFSQTVDSDSISLYTNSPTHSSCEPAL